MNIQRISLIAAAVGTLALSSAASAQDAAKLAQEKACLACHAIDKKVVGPSYKEVAAKYRSDKNAEVNLAK